MSSERDYLTTVEFARLYGLSRSTVARLVDRGRIPARRVGSHRRIFKIDLETAGLAGNPAVPPPAGRTPRREDILQLADRIRELAVRRGARQPRLFGSVARDAADALSDVDLLVDLEPERSLIDLAQLELDLEALLGRGVDVRTPGSLRQVVRQRVLAEAIPLLRTDADRVRDILEAISRIERQTVDGKAAFVRDELLQTWVVYHLEIIGEAAKGLSEDFRVSRPDTPWSAIARMRDRLVHWDIDLEAVWQVLERDLPELQGELTRRGAR